MDTGIDFGHTAYANRRRNEKAKILARDLYAQGVTAEQAAAYDDQQRKQAEKRAGLRTSHRFELWYEVVVKLEDRAEWDAAHPPTCPTCGQPITAGRPISQISVPEHPVTGR